MPADPHLHIRDADTWDTTAIVDTLTYSVAATSAARWMLPDNDIRTLRLKPRLAAVVAVRVAAGTVRIAEDNGQIIGATMWMTCTATDDTAADPHAVLLASGPDAHRSRQLHAHYAQRHPTRAHHHLLALGVQSDRQRQGIGATLLADWHEQLRPGSAGTFLLASSALFGLASTAGYHTLGEPIAAMVTSPPLYAMWNPAPRLGQPRCDADPTAQTSAPAGAAR